MAYKLEEFTKYSIKHTELIKLWWKEFCNDPIDNTMTDHGFMVFKDDRPMAAVFLYPVFGCKMAMIGFPIANPLVFKEERREALSVLVAGVENKAKSLHYEFLVSYAGNEASKGLFKRLNYKEADINVTNYVKKI